MVNENFLRFNWPNRIRFLARTIFAVLFNFCYLKPKFHESVLVACDCVTDVTALTTTRFQLTTTL